MDKKTKKSRLLDSKVLWAVISLLASVLLRVYVTTSEGDVTERTYDGVQVVFKGEDSLLEKSGMVISNVSAKTVSVRIKTTRREISKLSSTNMQAVVDVSKFSSEGMYNQSVSIAFPTGSNTGSIDVVSTLPGSISFNIDKTSSKTIDLKGSFVGTVAEGFAVQPIKFDPQSVTITGPKNEIEKVAYAWVEVNRDNADKTIQFSSSYVLMDNDGNEISYSNITLSDETVAVTVPITSTKVVPLDVDVVDGGGATRENVKISCDPETITIAGDAETLEGINKISVGTIDLASFESTFEDTYQIVLDNNVSNVTGITSVKVTIEVVGLETKKFNVTNISTINVPEGRKATVVTENKEVILRGTESVLSKISSNNIRVVADLTDIGSTAGIFEPDAKVYVDGFTGVGAIGEYSVYIKLK
ncbi:MAG: CdaR family protein [Oscillospiraceae bacterium]|nr:CdaR family protein [Oscillospiraceae bacterium]